MRILGIDYGMKRIGIAVSDEEGKFAFPKKVIDYSSGATDEIVLSAEEAGARTIVVGESKDFGGRENLIMEKIKALQSTLEAKGFSVALEPEFFSSVEAGRFQGITDSHDASAAAIILQRYLDKQRHS